MQLFATLHAPLQQSTEDIKGEADAKAPYEAEHGRFQYGNHGR